jgi:hypothetical protein
MGLGERDKRLSEKSLVADDADESRRPDIELNEGIARGERALADGQSSTHAQAIQRMARWLT